MTTSRKPIVIGGPTASGKSALALTLAEKLDGEIVCADSRQLYAGLPIASAAPDDDELARVPHHLYGSIAPDTTMTAGAWAALCDDVTARIIARGKVPIVVGGTGLYMRAWRVGLEEPSDPVVRARLEAECARDGAPALHAKLRQIDPDAADAIEPTDALRVVRALEIAEVKGGPRGALDLTAKPARVDAHWLLVDAPLDHLEKRIAERTVRMFALKARDGVTASLSAVPAERDGVQASLSAIVVEARALAARVPGHRLLETIGVKEALAVANATLSVDEAIRLTTLRTRQYARRQRTWFKKEPWWTRLDATHDAVRLVDDALRSLSSLGMRNALAALDVDR